MQRMPTKPDDNRPTGDDRPTPATPRFSGVGKYVESGDVAGLMRELDKVDTTTKEAILNKISMSDGKGGRIELDGHQMVTMPDWMLIEVQQQIEMRKLSEQGDAT